MMSALAAGFLKESLSGYLLVVTVTSAFPLVRKASGDYIPRWAKRSLKVHPDVIDLQELYPAECFALFLACYPALLMYQSVAGSVLGSLALAVVLAGVLGRFIGPKAIELREAEANAEAALESKLEAEFKTLTTEFEDFQTKSKAESNALAMARDAELARGREEVVKLKDMLKTETSARSSALSADTDVPALQDENSTPTAANTSEDREQDPSPKEVAEQDIAAPQDPGTATPPSILDKLCPPCTQKLQSQGVRISNIRSVAKRHSSGFPEDDCEDNDETLSVVTWDPAFAKEDAGGAKTPTELAGAKEEFKDAVLLGSKSTIHRRNHSCSVQDSSLLKEMDGNLIDSNLEPHYSNLIDSANAPIFGVDSEGVSHHRPGLSEPQYSSLIDSANAPIFGVDSEGRVNVWNKCAMRIVGYTPDEVMGKNLVKEFITKDYQSSVGMVIERALRGDETANYEFPLMTKEGVRIEILLNATARRNPDGKIIGVVGIRQDMTGRIAQERE
ncbi:hypothetical protein ACHAWF_017497 [Thalassiosira exigua]